MAHAIAVVLQAVFCCRCVGTLLQVIEILRANDKISLDESYTGGDTEKTEEPAANESIVLWGNVAAFVERLDDELFKSLQVSASPKILIPLCCLQSSTHQP